MPDPHPNPLPEGEGIFLSLPMREEMLLPLPLGEGWGEGTNAQALNLGCLCRTLDPALLRTQLDAHPGLAGLTDQLAHTHPHLFSQSMVFLESQMHDALVQAVAALHRVMTSPGWLAQALPSAGAAAQHDFGPAGVFMGYDFHISPQGPRLIEINTNAGGAFLCAALAQAQHACCSSMGLLMQSAQVAPGDVQGQFMTMFDAEWQAQRGTQPWRSVLIIDDEPQAQYLAPEFALARQMFEAHGLVAAVADARSLLWRDGHLWHSSLPPDLPVDMVYNRLTDFDLSDPAHAALRSAYDSAAVVLTPHPRVHALQAHKRHLITLGNDALLADCGVSASDRELLRAVVPKAEPVTATHATELWARRRQLFFKPMTGYGGKAAYRGDKLTRKVWQEIVAGQYVAQELVPPSERLVQVDGQPTHLKLDLRAYAYRGQVQLLAARTWAGQTTNFRTPGGGFAPVMVLSAQTPSRPTCA